MERIPFSPPRIDDTIIQEVTNALKSGWITTGPRTKKLEAELQNYTQTRKVLCVNSATAGMELALRWWGVGPGDEVIIPAYTYCATANVVIHCGAKPVMVDVDPADATLNIKQVEASISSRTKAIIPVDLGGMPVQYDRLKALLQSDGVCREFQPANEKQETLGRPLILTDAAHSLGATYQGKPAAQQPDIAVFSFHAVKNLTTAEGGAICLNLPASFDVEAIYSYLNTLSLHGQNKDALAKFGKNAWEYDVIEAGYKCNMPDVLAAIGLVELGRYEDDTLPKRLSIVGRYQEALKSLDWAETPLMQDDKRVSSAHLYLLRLQHLRREQRDDIIRRVVQAGVSVNVHYKPLPLLTYYKNLGYRMEHYPVSCNWFKRVITLPVFYDLTDAQQDRVVETLADAVRTQRAQKSKLSISKSGECY